MLHSIVARRITAGKRPGTLPRMKRNAIFIPAALGALALIPTAATARHRGPVAHAVRLGNNKSTVLNDG